MSNSALCEIQRNQSNLSPLKIRQSINAESACDRNNKSMYRCFYESKKERGKKKIVEMYFFKVLAKNFLLTCSWPIFYQMDFMKR